MLARLGIPEYASRIVHHHNVFHDGWVDVHLLTEKLGGALAIGTDNVSLIVEDDAFTIFVPATTTWIRDRFLIAHELGHLFLHFLQATAIGDGQHQRRFSRGGTSTQETEADIFAAGLLMPQQPFEDAYVSSGKDVYQVAQMFRSSTTSVGIRSLSLRDTCAEERPQCPNSESSRASRLPDSARR